MFRVHRAMQHHNARLLRATLTALLVCALAGAAIDNPRERWGVQEALKRIYADKRMMGESIAQATVGEYLRAIRQIRDDPKASRQVKEQCVKKLIDTMWDDPR